jgi:hypothetical protein
VVLLLLASCGGGGRFSAPSNLENACSIVRERPNYLSAMRATERKWGVPVPVQMATIHAESRFIGNAQTPFRYALGVIPMGVNPRPMATARRWTGLGTNTSPRPATAAPRRDDIRDATDFMGWYMTKTEQRNNIPKWDARNQYLAYHEGHTGFARAATTQKAWLLRVADGVADRAVRYDAQLAHLPGLSDALRGGGRCRCRQSPRRWDSWVMLNSSDENCIPVSSPPSMTVVSRPESSVTRH